LETHFSVHRRSAGRRGSGGELLAHLLAASGKGELANNARGKRKRKEKSCEVAWLLSYDKAARDERSLTFCHWAASASFANISVTWTNCKVLFHSSSF
jgi:hypothetical protein